MPNTTHMRNDARHPLAPTKRGDFLRMVLEGVVDGTINTVAAFLALGSAGYGASQGQLAREFEDTRASMLQFAHDLNAARDARRKYQQLLSRLRCDGLIEIPKTGKWKGFLSLTTRGRGKLVSLRAQRGRSLPLIRYQHKTSNVFTIVAFDVPEKERRKRDWLRAALEQLGFQFIQWSVCVGNIRLPESFLNDLKILHLLKNVEIFQVTKTGSLERLRNHKSNGPDA